MNIRDDSFGFEQRAKRRQGRQGDVRNYVQSLIADKITRVIFDDKESAAQLDIEQVYEEIILNLQTKYRKFELYRYARNHLSKLINDGNREGKWSLRVPAYIHRYRREATLRSARWFNKSRNLNAWTQEWLSTLANDNDAKPNLTGNTALGNCLVSACIFGGLCIPEALESFMELLLVKRKPLSSSKYGVFIELYFTSKSEAFNAIVNDKEITLRRWYPDPLTLGLIATFLHGEFVEQGYEKESLWSVLSDTFKRVDSKVIRYIRSVEALCSVGAGVIENMPNCDIDQLTVAYLSGKVSSASLPHDVYKNISTSSISGVTAQYQKHVSKRGNVTIQLRQHSDESVNIEKTISDLRLALAPKDANGQKRSNKMAIASLNEIRKSPLKFNFEVLLLWLEDMLKTRKIKVSSASRYWSAIGTPWLAHTSDIDFKSFESEDFDELYRLILNTTSSDKNRRYMAARLDQIHSFLQRQYQLPSLTSPLSDGEGKVSQYVRAYYIPQFAFAEVLSLLDQSLDDKGLRLVLKVLFIIAIRTGMRLGELLKLRINDIESSDDSWVFVRSNKFADGKSLSSLRKIPLNVLLLSEEVEFIKRYISTKRQIAKSDNILLFSESNTPHVPLNPTSVGNVFSQIASAVTGVTSTFHGLRHTALSNLHLVVEDQILLLKDLVGYSQNDISEIKRMLGFTESNTFARDKYWLLASFAGHTTPETTFGNYLHFTDYIAAQKIRSVFNSIPKASIESALDMSKNAKTRLNNRSKNTSEWHENIASWIESKITPYIAERINQAAKSDKKVNIDGEGTFLFKPTEPTIELCYSVLKYTEDGELIDEIVSQHNLENSALVSKWISNAKILQGLTTRKGRSRFLSRTTTTRTVANRLAPHKPESNIELKDANTAIAKMRALYKIKKEEVIWSINYFIQHSNRSNPFIHFTDISSTERFLDVVLDAFPPARWEITMKGPSSKIDHTANHRLLYLKKQGIGVRELARNYQRQVPLTYLLRLKHPEEAKIVEKRKVKSYSARTLGYLFHMLKIML